MSSTYTLYYFLTMTSDNFKGHLTSLFTNTERYHKRKLRELFRRHYDPSVNDHVWTTHLSEDVVNELRLHLSWELGIRTFQWSREAVGTRILIRFEELGILLFMKHIIKQDRNLS